MIQKILLASVFVLCSQATMAQQDTFQEGTHYFKINQVSAPASDNSVEVTVVFSYLCGHCNALEPYIEAWAKRKPENVHLNRMHVNFGGASELFARAYIVSEMTGVAKQSHPALMKAIWQEKKRFRNVDQLADFFTQFGLEKERFMANFESFAADSQLRRVERDVQIFGVTGTPTIIVNRKYRVPNTARVWDVVDFLVARELAAADNS
ncbi:MAG: thiol:disulfide interchange protein DsbA/DsbL [Xanthomonadales bacterium]|nr:thiol:disulfide interchange protein DsbA/DsbL [Xanthomonadales bacterium]